MRDYETREMTETQKVVLALGLILPIPLAGALFALIMFYK